MTVPIENCTRHIFAVKLCRGRGSIGGQDGRKQPGPRGGDPGSTMRYKFEHI